MRQKTHFLSRGGATGGGGGGVGVLVKSSLKQFCVSRVTKQIVYLISVKCLGDLCVTINSLV